MELIDRLRQAYFQAVEAGEPLTLEQCSALYESADLHTLGQLACTVRERLHGRRAYFNINRHINYTNYCVLSCKFCSFYRPLGRDEVDDGYLLSVEEVVERAQQAYQRGATEVHIVGGLHPRLPFSYYIDMCASIRDACPKMHIKAFTAIEIIHFSRIAKPRMSIEQVLIALRDAGLGSLPGGGAEIFDDRVHNEAFKAKVGEAEWFEVHRIAHELGIFTNATMLFGHVETRAERLGHLEKLRIHQQESLRSRPAHFNCVVPLPFIPQGSALEDLPASSGLEDLRTLAITRLMCQNVSHIKAFWPMYSPKIAQVSLDFGVDDLDGTVVYYDITKEVGDGTHQEMSVEKITRLIREARCEPIERDSLYRRVIRDGESWHIEDESADNL